MKKATQVIHTGIEPEKHTGASSVPIFMGSTFHQTDIDEIPAYEYSRSGNPTREALETALAKLEGGTRAFALASGMAAMTTAMALFGAGDHVIASRDIYGGTYRLLSKVWTQFGVETTFVDTTDLEAIKEAGQPNTKGLILESPSNPTLAITDIKGAVAIAKENNWLTLIDNTFMTPYLQQPLELGVDVVVHSATKFLGGHSDLVAGAVVVKDKNLGKKLSFYQNAFGAILSPHDSWLLIRGLKTLAVRMEASQKSAEIIASYLAKQKGIEKVYYPGLVSHKGYDLQLQQAEGAGAVLSFDLGNREKVKKFLQKTKLPLVAVSLGGVESILSYPTTMSHGAMEPEERLIRGIGPGLIRLSVGLEDPDDLIDDLHQALEDL
ncbi:aminotransferase class I/II-fold pyridoxal phosphate-dependent enzyme [Heliorestis acidaminivorans]|uniref:cysteine-S-conjugate beta-lyase n=1 Tax=Heliorestis acidaminivorans TaxID=553427 RepID=A0A6I0F0I7_9FIRM|nr:aminotransferase class I/II-fold pyridoxal phosphate-dependent enzyme [Heliorestis acidaminivorans]KAB2951825.1 aminotransferase class I/II-fold pyridoxal phosphate-dependent enzyme [Heliorestis acidaminivorans]